MPAQFPDMSDRHDEHFDSTRRPNVNKTGINMSDIVISGISGRFPQSESMAEFKENLYNGVDMVTDLERRWPKNMHGLPARTGTLKDLSRFDATFFSVHAKQAEVMDPQLRIMLEATFEALVDAGLNPEEIKGSNTGVFIGMCSSESSEYWTQEPDRVNGYGLTGNANAMFPNRVSFTFDLKGPSFAVDTACSSSMIAFHLAVSAIRNGECDAAIVGGLNVLLKPNGSLQFHRLGMLSPDGACKAFDVSGNGYVRSEACVSLLLQKASNSKRAYAYVINTGINTDGNKEQGITFPSGATQKKLMETVFSEVGLNPAEVSYVEAHGTGTKVGDPQEVNSIADFFCKGRTKPLLIGSVKSNMGHSEPASGLCSLAKLVIAMEENKIPGNLHFSSPNMDIPALSDGSIQVVHQNWDWDGGFAAINSFGFGGANAHAILRSNPKNKSPPVKDNIPRLVCVSGRTEEAVQYWIEALENLPRDDDLISLIHSTHKRKINGHNFRGYTVLGGKTKLNEVAEELDKKQVWFVYSGMGSQWVGMGRAYMGLQIFSDAIQRCAAAVKTEGLDLLHLINNGEEKDFENVVNSFVCIAAIQVALTDLLRALGITPSGIIGHSAGELGCAYADGTFTPEQTVLAAYWRGRSVMDAKLQLGRMAAVGLTWEEAKARCPPGVIAACHNGNDSVTISGAASAVEKFVKELTNENIFAKIVQSSGIAFHSKYIADAAPLLRSSLEKIIPAPKPRSGKWLSSSVPEDGWNSQLAGLSSAAYHVNNLLSPVLFHEVVKKIPADSLVLEVAPQSLLQGVLKRSLPKSCTIVGLFKKGIADELGNFMSNIGTLYLAGLSPNLSVFHHSGKFPVAKGTPMIAPMIKWDHSIEWSVADFSGRDGTRSGESVVEINTSNENDAYITGHTIDGRVLFPATGYLTLVWKAYAKKNNKSIEECRVTMENVSFLRATIMPKEGSVKFSVSIMEGSGDFELCESGNTVVTGRILSSEGLEADGLKSLQVPAPVEGNVTKELTKSEVYKYLRLRGYDYQGLFRGIKRSDNYGANGVLEWSENWISFMDTMLQFSLISMNTNQLYLPTRLLKITIDPQTHLKLLKDKDDVAVQWYKHIKVIRSGGVEIRGMKASMAPKRSQTQSAPKFEQYRFVPYHLNKQILRSDALSIALQIVLENSNALKLVIVESHAEKPENFLATDIVYTLESEPMCAVEMTIASAKSEDVAGILEPIGAKHIKKNISKEPIELNAHLVISSKVAGNPESLKNALASVRDGGFVLTVEPSNFKANMVVNGGAVEVISTMPVESGVFILLRKPISFTNYEVINIKQSSFNWLSAVKKEMSEPEKANKVLLVSDEETDTGIIGMFNCLKQEPGGERFRCVYIADHGKKFVLTSNKDQLKKDLLVNVQKGGEWGSMRHLIINNEEKSLDVEHAYVNNLTRGDLASLRWIEGPMSFARPEHQPNKEMCSIYYAPLNFKDVMIASGKLPADSLPGHQGELECIMGLEFAGRNSKGQRVIGVVEAQAMATSIFADPLFLWSIPAKWTMEEACSISTVYITSYYALIVRGRMRAGESVLIHAGTGGVGQASINIALSMGCEVFTTVGSQQKRDFLAKNFPKLKPENIGNSRDASFEQLIMQRTNGKGVDLVLNSLAMELLQASLRCLAEHGRFLEIGKVDLANNSALGMAVFLKNISVHGILLDALFEVGDENKDKVEVSKLLREGIESGVVKPLPVTIFESSQVEQAFRFMASGKHIGKVVLKIKNEEESKVVKNSKSISLPAIPRTYMSPDKSYILLGGLGGFGLELAQWMFTRGARHMVLVSRSGVTTGYQAMCIRKWEAKGHIVTVSKTDARTIEGAKQLIKEASSLAPVGGIFNLAAVLKDAYIENQTVDNFKTVCQAKIDTTKALDVVSRTFCPELDYFVVFSSVSCGRGNAGQTNYGMANSSMERICEIRQTEGFPGAAIQWGAIGDVGLVIEGLRGDNETVVGGTLPQRIASCIATMDSFLLNPHPVMASMVLADRRKKTKDAMNVSLIDAVGNILGIKNVKNISNTSSLADLGMDSLMGAEIKQTLERGYDLILSPAEIRSLTFGKLKDLSESGEQMPTSKEGSVERNLNGQNDLVSYLEDKLTPTSTIVKMKDGKGAPKTEPLFFIHAIEGNVAALHELAQATDENEEVYGLQCTGNAPLESIEKLAESYILEIKKIQTKGPYRLVGYSFGAGVAIEMGLQLEACKEKVKLTLLDGAHSYVNTHISSYRDRRNKKAGDADAFTYFITLFDPRTDFAKMQDKLNSLPTINERLELCTSMLSDIISYHKDDIKSAAMSFYKKLLASDKYTPATKFAGDVTLIKSSDNFVGVGSDYGLSEICSLKPKVYQLEDTTHRSLLQGKSVESIAQILKSS